MKKNIFLILTFLFPVYLFGQTPMAQLIDENFKFAEQQYLYMMQQGFSRDRVPQSYYEATGNFDARDIYWWCSGFYPGSLWYIFEQTNNDKIKSEAERILKLLEPVQHYKGNHDLGFMIHCSFGNAYRLTGDASYKDVIFNASESLSSRYKPEIKSIQSWEKNDYFNAPAIIDNMMNLEMLLWASQNGADKKYWDIAVTHANTTIKEHFRKDNSSYHIVDYDLDARKVLRKGTWQGASDNSSWARGQAWGLYGYVTMYRFTKDRKYLKQAEKIANFTLNHPNLPDDKIPYWDFDAPLKPKAKRDASAGAINASALLELAQYTKNQNKRNTYLNAAEEMIRSLASPAYKAELHTNGGFLLKHSVGAMPLNSEIDVPLIYADYYFLEALKRYKEWYL